MINDEFNEYCDYLIECGIATEDEIQLVTTINGFTIETLDDILYARTGYRTLEQYKDDIEEDNIDEDDFFMDED